MTDILQRLDEAIFKEEYLTTFKNSKGKIEEVFINPVYKEIKGLDTFKHGEVKSFLDIVNGNVYVWGSSLDVTEHGEVEKQIGITNPTLRFYFFVEPNTLYWHTGNKTSYSNSELNKIFEILKKHQQKLTSTFSSLPSERSSDNSSRTDIIMTDVRTQAKVGVKDPNDKFAVPRHSFTIERYANSD